MKKTLRKYTPNRILLVYHWVNAFCAALWYGFPGKKLFVIGITGTKGKTTTANFVWSVLTAGNIKTGIISTANIRIGSEERLNLFRMTFPPAWQTQKLLHEMYKAGCTHVVLEATSIALSQNRFIGIDFKTGIFTNLSPEHLELHGNNFESYRDAKRILFSLVEKVPSGIAIINADSGYTKYFSGFNVSKEISYGIKNGGVRAENISETTTGVDFVIGGDLYHSNLLGAFNIYNILPAIILGKELGLTTSVIQKGLYDLHGVPGRMEIINEGQTFTVIVDYAHEGLSTSTVITTAKKWLRNSGRILVVSGATGGLRDKAKRTSIGNVAGEHADIFFITDEDPYDTDPKEIMNDIKNAAIQKGKKEGENLFVIPDRKVAIEKAIATAKKDDIVLILGKGAEQTMQVKNGAIPWDDRVIARDALRSL